MAFEGLLPSGLIYRSRWQARNASSVLSLLRRLLDAHPDRERLAGAAVTRPAQGRCAQVIEPDSDPHMGVGGAKSVGRIESDPAASSGTKASAQAWPVSCSFTPSSRRK